MFMDVIDCADLDVANVLSALTVNDREEIVVGTASHLCNELPNRLRRLICPARFEKSVHFRIEEPTQIAIATVTRRDQPKVNGSAGQTLSVEYCRGHSNNLERNAIVGEKRLRPNRVA